MRVSDFYFTSRSNSVLTLFIFVLFLASPAAISSRATLKIVARAQAIMATLPTLQPTETAMRQSEATLRARIYALTHEISYLLNLRSVLVKEHDDLTEGIEAKFGAMDIAADFEPEGSSKDS